MHPETGQIYRGNIERLLAKIHDERGLDLGQYRRAYIERRLAARLRALGLHTYRQYTAYLDAHPEEFHGLLDTLTINVTDFFRDKSVYDVFAREVVPVLLEEKLRSRHRMVRVWSAGCATGEEPYSIAMTILEAAGRMRERFLLGVTGTDIDPKALSKAKRAEYDVAALKHIPPSYQLKYVEAKGDRFVIRPEVTSCVRFNRLDLFRDRPLSVVDVIFCRNVFIYFNRDQQERVLETFWSALHRGGYLVLGKSEKLSPGPAGRFELVNGRERIYRKPLGL